MSSKKKQMVINYVPGEECRVAIVDNGRLEEFHSERMDGPSNHVGNIYVGKVMNVEQSIQAAFIDFGLEQNGFLHTSDVHPQYFGSGDGDKTERVGRKTPRRERPPIQDCFRRGDEVAVQVLKEGVGTKGPTVTSYLSIPGRFLVMMPQMDKVGVSRKVEDEDTRRKMREILDQLDLPDGFGFILRTAGMERSKAELKRDLAYLMRLWKDMERRWKSGNKPRLLYSESDLLVRALRDMLTTDIDEVVVDNQAALARAARFLKIVAPRTSTRLVHYTGASPVFHVMGIEPQIQMIHAREVPLPSGGRLVIDEAEALVAIDVNSGKSREARDSETNAYETNLEAVDEICRQLRLRDLGGVIVNDLIDMRSAKHRRDIEARFAENLKKDRARWTTAPISEFGILEMTRQRMRASHESQHFTDCPTCRGRGLVQRPDSVAGDALRELAALLDAPGVQRVELVVHPRIAGELLSTKRRALGRIERASGKHVDVRVSEAILVDRVSFYAYDDRGADLDIAKLGHRRATEAELVTYEITSDAGEEWAETEHVQPEPEQFPEEVAEAEAHPIELEPLSLAEIAAQDRSRHQQQRSHGHQQQGHHAQRLHGDQGEPGESGGGAGRRRRRRRGRRGGRGQDGAFAGQPGQPSFDNQPYPPSGDGQYADVPNGAGGSGEDQYTDGQYQEGQYAQPGQQQPYNEGEYAPADGEQGNYAGSPDAQGGYDQQQFGPGGAPGEGGEHGGGRRRRRRRGRRGRGGNGNGAPGQPGDAQHFNDHGQPYEGDGQFAQQPAEGDAAFSGQPSGEYSDSGEFAPRENAGEYSGDAGNQPQHGGAPHGYDQNNSGEGGGRGRRRRGRRGGRGRGGEGFDGPRDGNRPGAPQPEQHSLAAMFRDAPPAHSTDDSPAQPFEPAAEGELPTGNYNPPAHDAGDAEFDGSEGDGSSMTAFGPEGGEPGEGGPRRRRRRGRRGGRNRDNAPEGAPSRSSEAPASARPAPEPKPAPAPRAQPAPAQDKPKPQVRTLYGSRRRIAPGEIKNTKREE